MKLCTEKGLNCDPTIGFSIMETLQLTKRHLSSSLSQKFCCWTEHPFMEWIWPPFVVGVLNIKIYFEGIRFLGHHRRLEECDYKAEGIRTEDFHKCFQQWQHGWSECVATEEYYFKSKPFHAVFKYRNICNKIIPCL